MMNYHVTKKNKHMEKHWMVATEERYMCIGDFRWLVSKSFKGADWGICTAITVGFFVCFFPPKIWNNLESSRKMCENLCCVNI